MDLQLEDRTAPENRAQGRQLKLALDVGERLFAVVMFSLMVWRFLPVGITFGTAPALLTEGLGTALMVVRRPARDVSMRPWDWFIGLVGVAAPTLTDPAKTVHLTSSSLCGATILCGLALSIWGKVILWRGFGLVAANRGVVQSGPYNVVRHPIYSGYLVTYAAFVLGYFSLRNVAVEIVATGLIVVRIIAEERVLSADPAYQAFKGRVRYRLIPGLF